MAKATEAGIIVVAAAGNCVQPIVVYPARDSNAIAIGGSLHSGGIHGVGIADGNGHHI
jgi:hypothetical protein